MKGTMKVVIGCLLICSFAVHANDEVFTFVEMASAAPISNATVELYRFASDISYDYPHPDLLAGTYKTDSKGMARIDSSRIPHDKAVFHVAGYMTSDVTYCPVLGRLAMPVDIKGHIRVVRVPDKGKRILGNSIYDLDARKEYFVDVDHQITTNALTTIRIDMKKSEQGGGAVRRTSGTPLAGQESRHESAAPHR
jgi:hypothetical protein